MKNLLMAGILTFVLSTATFAGDIPTDGFAAPPPPSTQSTLTQGDVPTAGIASSLIQAVFSWLTL